MCSSEQSMRLTDRERACMRQDGNRKYVDTNMHNFSNNDYRLFVRKLAKKVTTRLLAEAFSHYPSFERVRIIYDRKKKQKRSGRGFGFVSFFSSRDFEHALIHMNGKLLEGKAIEVYRSKHSDKMDPNYKRESAVAPTLNYKIYAPKKK